MNSITTVKALNEYKAVRQERINYTKDLKSVSLESIFYEIQTSHILKNLTKKLRAIKNDDDQQIFKKENFPYFNLGAFQNNHRLNVNLISTSFFIYDYDHLEDKLQTMKDNARQDKNVYAYFVSPRGNGLKIIYRLEEPITDHEKYSELYQYYAKIFKINLGADPDKTSDASRACFYSYDPEMYLNPDAEPLKTIVDFKYIVLNVINSVEGADGKEERDINADERKESKKNFKELLEPKGPGERHFTLLEIINRLLSAKLRDDDIRAVTRGWNLGNSEPMSETRLAAETNQIISTYKEIKGEFWKISRGRASLSLTQYIKFLNQKGFGKVSFGKTHEFIRIVGKVASILTTQEIKDFVFSHVINGVANKTYRDKLTELMYDGINKYFSEKLLETVDAVEMNMKSDLIHTAFLFYKNGIVTVKNGVDPIVTDYSTLEAPVWDTQIKDRIFDPIQTKYKQSEFERFLWNAMKKNDDRMLALCSAIGYLLHRYKNRSVAKAIIFMDEKVSEVPVGRTGKSLVGKAISYIRSSVRVDGKNFQFREQFTFQQINPTTEILEFNDVRKDFDFERLFSALTDDMTIEYKNQHPFAHPFEKSPKMMVSTNYSIRGIGDSFGDRMFEVEFSDYYSSTNKPVDEFGHLFFDDWDTEEWNRFDNFMVECLQLYLDNGLVNYKKINIDNKKLLMETSAEFVEFMRGCFVVQFEYDKDELFQKFKTALGFDNDLFNKCQVKKNTFTKYLKTYANYSQLEYTERGSNGKQYVLLK